MVAKTATCDSSTFEQLNAELNDFYQHLKDSKFTDEHIDKMLEPLRAKLRRKELLQYAAILIFCLTTFAMISACYDTISWYALAATRLALVQLLPYWNWPELKNRQCLIYNFETTDSPPPQQDILFNCDICETIDAIDVHSTMDSLTLKLRYIDMDIPVILTDSDVGWPQGSHLVGNVSSDAHLRSSFPCNVAASVINGEASVGKLMDRTRMFDSFFLHFRNCDPKAVKEFRRFAARPAYLHAELAPVQSSWLLWSRDYNVSAHKVLDLGDRVAVVEQVDGANHFRLVPRANCEERCGMLGLTLEKGEVLVVTSMWDVEYRPSEARENVAVVLETR